MKYKLALLLGSSLALSSSAMAEVRFWLAYGDSNLVSLAKSSGRDASAAIGKAVPTDRALMIPSIGKSYKLQVHMDIVTRTSAEMLGGVPVTNAIQCAIGFDRAYGSSATFLDQKIGISGTGASYLSNWATGIVGHKNGTDGTFVGQFGFIGQGSKDPLEQAVGADPTVHGRYFGFAAAPIGIGPLGYQTEVPVGLSTRAVDFELTNFGLLSGDVYGDAATEAGITVARTIDRTHGSIFATRPRGAGNQLESTKFAVEAAAVPEPGAFLALIAGFTGLTLRRRARKV